MKKFILTSLSCLFLATSLTSCFGSFRATTSLYEWNEDATDSPFVRSLLFWGLTIIPVYELFALADIFILNVIEFWSGDDPLGMAEGESETRIVNGESATFAITASKNQFEIKALDGEREGDITLLSYKPEEKSWYVQEEGKEEKKISQYKAGKLVAFLPDGSEVVAPVNATPSMMDAYAKQELVLALGN